jgi:ribosomal protein S1
MLQGRIDEIEDDRLVLRVVDRLFGEPDGIQGDLPGDEMELVYPFPLGVFFRAGDRLPVQVSEVDSQEGRLLLTSPWIDRDPWQEGYVERRYRPGSIEKGTVVRVEAEEILVLLEPGIVGRMPLSPRGRYGLGVPVEVEIVDLAVASRALTLRRVPS